MPKKWNMKKISLLLLFLLLINLCFANIFPVKYGDLLGYIDENLQAITKPIYEEATNFDNGIAVVKQDSRYYLINQNFEKIKEIEADYLWLPPQNELIGFANQRNKVFFIDYDGDIVLYDLDSCLPFINGYSVIRKNEIIYLFSCDGKIIDTLKDYKDCINCGNGYYSVKNKNGLYGIVDANNNKIMRFISKKPIYSLKDIFVLQVDFSGWENDYIEFVDESGNTLFDVIYYDYAGVTESGIVVQYGAIGFDGFWKIINTQNEDLLYFDDNILIDKFVKPKSIMTYLDKNNEDNYLYGYIDVNGKKITEAIFDECKNFQFGYSEAILNGKNILVSENGEFFDIETIFR